MTWIDAKAGATADRHDRPEAAGVSWTEARRRTWEVVEVARPGDTASRVFDVFILSLIFLNVLAVILESVAAIGEQYAAAFSSFEMVSVAVFSIEYLARWWSCVEDARYCQPFAGRARFALRPLPLIDLLAIAPFFLSLVAVDLRFLRAVRLFRLFRLAKAGRYVRALRTLRGVLSAKRQELVLTGCVVLILMVLASSIMYYAEHDAQPDKFSSIPASMWWAVATLTTVGYGDVYPVTLVGKLAGAMIAILGIGLFALPTAIIGSGFIEAVQQHKAPRTCPHCGKPIE